MKPLISCFLSLVSINLFGQSFDSLHTVSVHEVYFESGSYDLQDESLFQLDSIFLIDSTHLYFLEGHTDLVGSAESNQILSENRVEAVKNYLISSGVEVEKIQSLALGERSPKINRDTELLENRRVSILVREVRKLRWITGSVVDDSTGLGIQALIRIQGKAFIDSINTRVDGEFRIAIPDKANYKMNVIADGYFFDERFIKVSKLTPLVFKVELTKAKEGRSFIMPNFNFKGDVAILVSRSVPTLELLYEVLDKSDVCIEIKGHVNRPNAPRSKVGSSDHKLSVDRAERVMAAMIKKGINPSRIVANGYSNWEMLFPKAKSAVHQAKNRRVEIVVIACEDVDKLKK